MLNRWRLVAAAALVFATPAAALVARAYATETVNIRAGPAQTTRSSLLSRTINTSTSTDV